MIDTLCSYCKTKSKVGVGLFKVEASGIFKYYCSKKCRVYQKENRNYKIKNSG
jgi:ribosomal protein L24E